MKLLANSGRVLILAVAFFGGHLAGAIVSGVSSSAEHPPHATPAVPEGARANQIARTQSADSAVSLGTLILVCLLEAIAVSAPLAGRVAATGRTGLELTFVIFGVLTAQAQSEAVYFGVISASAASRMAAMGAITATIAAGVTLRVWPQRRAVTVEVALHLSRRSRSAWVFRALACALGYVGLYLVFGYFVAWQQPALREFYGGSAPASFMSHLNSLVLHQPSLLGLQFARGLGWTLLAIVALRWRGAQGGAWWRVGLLFALLMNAQLLLPNNALPDPVRMAHLLETAPSNFLMGMFVAALFGRGHTRSASVPGA